MLQIRTIQRNIYSIRQSARFSSTLNKNGHFFEEAGLPKDLTSIPTHELLQKLGYIRQPHAGLVHWLPTGLKVLKNVENIIRRRMEEIGSEEVALSSLSNAELWRKTGRWNNSEIFKLKDIKSTDYCLTPTCEEEITSLVKQSLRNAKPLPLLYYQVTRKYRDEKRPRAGLLRGREFLMKDGYSFDVDEKAALITYNKVVGAYYKIFQDLKVPFVKAEADSGSIGGSLSHEWHYAHESGEDTLFSCDNKSCGHVSNIERTLSYPIDYEVGTDIEAEVRFFLTDEKDTLVAMYYPNDRTLAPSFAKEYVPDIDLELTNQEEVLKQFMELEGDIITKKIVRIMDSRINNRSLLPDFPLPLHTGSFATLKDIPIVEAQEGEVCYHCTSGTLTSSPAIEVGHTFYLGDKYSKSLDLSTRDADNNANLVSMGCYGIGVSRLVAAIAELTKDKSGLRWPASIAPYHLTLIEAPGENHDAHVEKMNELCCTIQEEHQWLKVQRDLRPLKDVSMGKKIKESNSLGIPLTVIVGKNYPRLEIEIRGERYGRDSAQKLTWEKMYEEKKDQLDWQVNYDKGEKHLVHVDGFVEVVRALLKDL